MTEAPLLSVEDLRVSYGDAQALFGIDLTLAEGEPDTILRDRLTGIADEYGKLANHLDPKP